MKATIGGRECYIYWEHPREEQDVMIGKSILKRRISKCHFKFRGETPETPIILSETIIWHPDTQFDKDKARKLTLAKLFRTYEVPRDERLAVWNTYHSRFSSPSIDTNSLEEAVRRAFSSLPGFQGVVVKQIGHIDVSPKDKTKRETDDEDDY